MFLRQSTIQTIRFGPFLDSTDGVTAETALTVAQADRQLSKDGGAFAQSGETGNSTHDTDGWYSDDLTATDTNTVGELILQVVVAGSLPVWMRWYVLEESVYDDLFASGAALTQAADIWAVARAGNQAVGTFGERVDANITQVSGDSAAADNLESDYDGTGYAKTNSTIGTCTTNSDMRGTDNAALASVLGGLADAAAAGDPTSADTLMQYAKQLVNVFVGTAGITTWPAEAQPGNAVSIAEAIRAIAVDVAGLNGDAMRGTDGANTTTPPTVIQIRTEMDSNSTQLAKLGTPAGASMSADIAAVKGDTVIPAKNQAFSNLPFLMVLTSDHVTPATGLTVTGQRSIDGGAFASVAGTIAEISNGMYQFDAAAADMNGDSISFRFSAATADDRFITVYTR